MDQTIQMKLFHDVKRGHTNCLKFGDRFFTSQTMLGFEARTSICSIIGTCFRSH